MSKEIDMDSSENWSDEDIQYLRDRGRLPQGFDGPSSQGDDEDDDSNLVEDYRDGWNNESRVDELEKRGLSTEGKKEELITRLMEDDAKKAEAAEDDDDGD